MIESRAWLRRYSLSNLLMILAQNPHATDVRPLREWNRHGRHVRKGEHGIRIWAPRFQRSPATAGPQPDRDGDRVDDHVRRLAGFILVSVFDIAQTDGDPLPDPAGPNRCALLSGDAPAGLWEALARQVAAAGFTIDRGECGGANGITDFAARTVRVRADVEPTQAAKTLAHELAHILCEHDKRADLRRETGEIEAESVACIVAAVCGLSTLDYSVPYVAGWAADVTAVRQSAERVLSVADRILAHIDDELTQPELTEPRTAVV
ncbi:ImmA/IrrE family metallo-endopeptidase [Actinokineospora sp. HBU206404]|uniref:ImmA/IrrE family metallo-endopeptidase n=2 Tax=Actinokineospora xionganensis TaxID=2684470 RepID=A0ABR7LG55_9PSEU|nr:ImmA/IrrE family metallo-endopeptidase [Actinokineospora xionganensis]